MVDVVGDDRAAARHLVADELGRHEIGDRRAEALAVADVVHRLLPPQVFASGDIFHLGRDDAATGIVHLADVLPGLRAQRTADDVGKGLHPAGAVRAELAIVLGAERAGVVALDVAAALDPRPAQLRQARADVDEGRWIGVRPGRVVDAQRRLGARGVEAYLPHCHQHVGVAGRGHVDLGGAADRAGGDADFCAGGPRASEGRPFDRRINVCHGYLLWMSETVSAVAGPPDRLCASTPSAGVNRIRFGGFWAMRPISASSKGTPGNFHDRSRLRRLR